MSILDPNGIFCKARSCIHTKYDSHQFNHSKKDIEWNLNILEELRRTGIADENCCNKDERDVSASPPCPLTAFLQEPNLLENSFKTGKMEDPLADMRRQLDIQFPTGHPDRHLCAQQVAVAIYKRIIASDSIDDLQMAITYFREVLALRRPDKPLFPIALYYVADAIHARFMKLGIKADLEEAIQLHRESLKLRPPGHSFRRDSLNGLAFAMSSSYQLSNSIEDLQETIKYLSEVPSLCPPKSLIFATALYQLAKALYIRYTRLDDVIDLEEAIKCHNDALKFRLSGGDRVDSLNQLAVAVKARFDRDGDMHDLEEAITYFSEARRLCSPQKHRCLVIISKLCILTASPPCPLTAFLQEPNLLENSFKTGKMEDPLADMRRQLDIQFPTGHPDRHLCAQQVAVAIYKRIIASDSIDDLQMAITYFREVLALRRPDKPLFPIALYYVADAIHARFMKLGIKADLEEAIQLHRESLKLRPPGHSFRRDSLNGLAFAMSSSYQLSNSIEDLQETIKYLSEVPSLCPPKSLIFATALYQLAKALYIRYTRLDDVIDLEEAIKCHNDALKFRLSGGDRVDSLNQLAVAVKARFDRDGDMHDLEEAITYFSEARRLCSPQVDDSYAESLNNFACAVYARFQQLGRAEDLEEAIACNRKVLPFRASEDSRRTSLGNLGTELVSRFKKYGRMEDLGEAIEHLREALDLNPRSNAVPLDNLGNAIFTLFQARGKREDLEEAILYLRRALILLPDPNGRRFISLNHLGTALSAQFKKFGSLDKDMKEYYRLSTNDLEESILYLREAVGLCPPHSPFRADCRNNLGAALYTRFQDSRNELDVEESIKYHREALNFHPPSDADRFVYLNNLANAIHARFKFTQCGGMDDLNEAITLHTEALKLHSVGYADPAHSLNNLSGAMTTRFRILARKLYGVDVATIYHRKGLNLRASEQCDYAMSSLKDIEDSIVNLRNAIQLTGDIGNPRKQIYLHNLSVCLRMRYVRLGELRDIDDAIVHSQMAAELIRQDSPEMSQYLFELGLAQNLRFEHLDKREDLVDSISSLRAAAQSKAANPHHALSAARAWADIASQHYSPSSALEGYRTALEILPKVAWLGLNITSRQEKLMEEDSENLSSLSATCAIQVGRLEEAVELLDLGRSVSWQQAASLRTDLEKLREVNPELADQLAVVGRKLDARFGSS
ncbi:hypothetical protein PILCRDRAFT_91764 [Piloderma croceum F 1598]|uniref:Uncharacterized protein n=1 Tax=Piloderma croceum (strain F 1598) TaxID=765440 RepID=A0A0C3F8W5_PILCF|nr:hypothetical protein PILCRDRAFT_91764 [Piloderma croceum F 1598]